MHVLCYLGNKNVFRFLFISSTHLSHAYMFAPLGAYVHDFASKHTQRASSLKSLFMLLREIMACFLCLFECKNVWKTVFLASHMKR